jgi:hypothetical protein
MRAFSKRMDRRIHKDNYAGSVVLTDLKTAEQNKAVWTETALPMLKQAAEVGGKSFDPNLVKLVTPLCFSGIDNDLRGEVWPLLIGNGMRLSRDIYDALIASMVPEHTTRTHTHTAEEEKGGEESTDTNTQEEKGSTTACGILRCSDKRRTILLSNLSQCHPGNEAFEEGGSLYAPCLRVIQAHAQMCPRMAYIQGVTYITSTFLLHMDEYHAFQSLCNFADNEMYLSQFRVEVDANMDLLVDSFNDFFKSQLPAVYNHFNAEGVQVEVFLLDWWLTMLSSAFKDSRISDRIWDSFLLQGGPFFFKGACVCGCCSHKAAYVCKSHSLSFSYTQSCWACCPTTRASFSLHRWRTCCPCCRRLTKKTWWSLFYLSTSTTKSWRVKNSTPWSKRALTSLPRRKSRGEMNTPTQYKDPFI